MMSIYYAPKTTIMRLGLIAASTVLLAACASPSADISIIPSQTAEITRKDGVFTQPLEAKKTKPGCKGECPTLQVGSLIFPGNKPLTEYVDQQLAEMVQFDEKNTHYPTVEAFTNSYWVQAGPRDEAILAAKPRYRNKDLTVLELGAWHYATGAAHGDSETRFINWDNQQKQPIPFTDIIQTRQQQSFNERLQQAHQQWLNKQEFSQEDRSQYQRLWPFQPSENIALTDTGVVVKYNSYEIAPYSSGQPELLIPYPQLQGILQPKYLPN